jgi:NAD(P)H-hydrate repair Nnr-like enzyme with NAD(P)H-hydrate dehydratase domain
MGVNGAYYAYAVLTAASIGTAVDANNQQKKANKERRKIQRAQVINERRQQIRQERVARAKAENQALISGGEGSVLSGAVGSITQQTGQSLSLLSSTNLAAESAYDADRKASNRAQASQLFSQGASIAGSFIGSGKGGKTDEYGFKKGQDPFDVSNY